MNGPHGALTEFRRELRERGLLRLTPARVLFELSCHASLMVAGLGLYALGPSWPLRLLGLPLFVLGNIGVVTNTHTSAHGATFRARWANDALSYFGFSFVTTYSYLGWRAKHNEAHHAFPNVAGRDPDHDFMPHFALADAQMESATPEQRARYRRQWLVFPFALVLMAPRMRLVALRFLLTRARGGGRWRRQAPLDLAVLAASFVAWWIVPLAFASPESVLLLHAARSVGLSIGLFVIFAPAHLPPAAPYLRKVDGTVDPMLRQLAVTLDYRCSRFASFFLSGLDRQLEHHIVPGVPHTRLREIAPLLEAFCRMHGFPYRVLPWGEAIRQSFGVLKTPKRAVDGLRNPSFESSAPPPHALELQPTEPHAAE